MITATYTDKNADTIRVAIEEGGHLRNISGPATFFVPANESNREFQALLELTTSGELSIGEALPPPVIIPDLISDRQFFQELANRGMISRADALAAVKTGEIPGPLALLMADLPEDELFASEMLISGATTFSRSHPLSETIRSALDWTSAQLDAFWLNASQL